MSEEEPTPEETVIEEVNDLLADALGDAATYASHEEVRPSAIRGFDRVQKAHELLTSIDPTREAFATLEVETDE